MKRKSEYTHNGSFKKSFELLLCSLLMSAAYVVAWLLIIRFAG